MKTKLIIEPHIHGAFGIDFNKSDADGIVYLAENLLKFGIGGFLPTLVTDTVDNLKRQIQIIKKAKEILPHNCAEILGVHLEGNFINSEKKGIHNSDYFLELTADNFKLIEDDIIKIVTLAPELDINLIDYLSDKDIKIQAGHCVGSDLSKCSGVTHLFNAMKGISHRDNSTVLSALINNDIYTEVIADGVHLCDDILNLIFKVKPINKIILISDALPITYSDKKEAVFADSKIYYDGKQAVSYNGTIAGSTTLVPDIIKCLISKNLFNRQYITNIYDYLSVDIDGEIELNDIGDVVSITKNGNRIN